VAGEPSGQRRHTITNSFDGRHHNGSVSTSFVSPGEGNTITVSAVLLDQFGNTSAPGSDSATVDTLTPVVLSAIGNVSEEGLPGGVPDTTGTHGYH